MYDWFSQILLFIWFFLEKEFGPNGHSTQAVFFHCVQSRLVGIPGALASPAKPKQDVENTVQLPHTLSS